MEQALFTSITRRAAGLAVLAAPMAALATARTANTQEQEATAEDSLYKQLGGIFGIAAVVDTSAMPW